MRFIGNIEAKIDSKGRVFLPATFRKLMQGENNDVLILRKDVFQQCLILYVESEWIAETNELRSHLNKWDAREQQIFRKFVADAEQVVLDSNGRLLIPKRYMKLANLSQNVRFIGMGNTIELWDLSHSEDALMNSNDFCEAIEKIMVRE